MRTKTTNRLYANGETVRCRSPRWMWPRREIFSRPKRGSHQLPTAAVGTHLVDAEVATRLLEAMKATRGWWWCAFTQLEYCTQFGECHRPTPTGSPHDQSYSAGCNEVHNLKHIVLFDWQIELKKMQNEIRVLMGFKLKTTYWLDVRLNQVSHGTRHRTKSIVQENNVC